MSAEQFRDLLKDYLTDPEYAEVEMAEDRLAMTVSLDDGSKFLVTVADAA